MNRPRPGFPDSFGSRRASVFPVTGPNPYTQYTAPATGGQPVQLLGPSGVKIADFVQGAVSRSGLYRAEVVQYVASTILGVDLSRAGIILKWYVVATGSEVAGAFDLSDEIVDLFILGTQ